MGLQLLLAESISLVAEAKQADSATDGDVDAGAATAGEGGGGEGAETQQPLKPTLKRQRADGEGAGARPNVQVQIASPTHAVEGAAQRSVVEEAKASSRPGSAALSRSESGSDDQQSVGKSLDTSSVYSGDESSQSQTSSRGAAAAVPLDTYYFKRMRTATVLYCMLALFKRHTFYVVCSADHVHMHSTCTFVKR